MTVFGGAVRVLGGRKLHFLNRGTADLRELPDGGSQKLNRIWLRFSAIVTRSRVVLQPAGQ